MAMVMAVAAVEPHGCPSLLHPRERCQTYSCSGISCAIMCRMKAIRVHRFGDPSVMKIEELPDPVPVAGQVMVKIHAVGVNPFDTYIRSGTYGKLPALPYTPGADAAGTVAAVGTDVRVVAPGDRVYIGGTAAGPGIGAYADTVICELAQVHPLPPQLSFAQGAGVNVPYVTAWRALFDRGYGRPGQTVLVHGASGGVGVAAVQIARAAGLRVLGTAGSDRGRALISDQGAHHGFDHAAPEYQKEILAWTGGRGVDLVIEMLANVNLVRDLEILATRGRVVVVGSRGSLEFNPRLVMVKDATVTGLTMWNATANELAAAHAAIVAGLENGALRPQVGRELPLARAPEAHEMVLQPGAYGKIVLIP